MFTQKKQQIHLLYVYREMREKIEQLKARVKESAVRTRTYEENRELKQLKKRKGDPEEAGQNTTIVSSFFEILFRLHRITSALLTAIYIHL